MRGDPLHNAMGREIGLTLENYFFEVHPEYKYCRNGIVTFLDLFASQGSFVFACEIETTARHGVDNAVKAAAVNIPLWIIVPTNKVKLKLLRRLKPLKLRPGGEPIKILLLGQLQKELEGYLSLRRVSELQSNIPVINKLKGENGL